MSTSRVSFYCITLESTPERTAHAKGQFEREGVEVTWVWGIDACKMGIKPALPMHDNPDKSLYYISPGACGLVISHYIAFRFAEKDDSEMFVVFEDDVVLPEGFLGKLDQLILDWPKDSLGIWLEHCCVDPSRAQKASGELSYALPMCTAAVMYKKEALPHLFKAIQPAHAPVDILIKERAGGFIRPVITSPQMCFQATYAGEMPSLIQSTLHCEMPTDVDFIY